MFLKLKYSMPKYWKYTFSSYITKAKSYNISGESINWLWWSGGLIVPIYIRIVLNALF